MNYPNRYPIVPRIGRIPVLPTLPPWLHLTQGNIFHIMPGGGGADVRDGVSPTSALDTFLKLKSLMQANQNDVGLVYPQGDSSALCTDYQSALLTWDKDLTHLVGNDSGTMVSPRARIAFAAAYAAATQLFLLSANCCSFSGIQFFAGVVSALPTGAVEISGERNHFSNCHIAGIGNVANDIAGASSLKFTGASEILIEDCVIGLGTIVAGLAANSEILFQKNGAGGRCTRITFRRCIITRQIGHATNHPLVKVADADTLEDVILFDNCCFQNWSLGRAYTQTGVFKFASAQTRGEIELRNCSGFGATHWDVDDSSRIQLTGTTPTTPAGTLASA